MNSDDPQLRNWRGDCAEYFADFQRGRYDESSQHWYILSRDNARIEPHHGDFVVGEAGCDGIYFCFRKGLKGVWAYYPIDDEHVLLASTLHELERGWLGGTITV